MTLTVEGVGTVVIVVVGVDVDVDAAVVVVVTVVVVTVVIADVVSGVVSMVADDLPTIPTVRQSVLMYNTYASVGLRSEQAGCGGQLRRANALRAH